MSAMQGAFDPSELQGNILRGYRRAAVRYAVFEVVKPVAARRWLGRSASGGDAEVPAVTPERSWSVRPDYCFNVGLTFAGLRALGLGAAMLAQFPGEFAAGMVRRAVKLGDVGTSAPECWPAPFDQPARVHLVAAIYADDGAHLDAVQRLLEQGDAAQGLRLMGIRNGGNFDGDFVHFGYRDNISQPRFAEIAEHADLGEPIAPLGMALLGHSTGLEGVSWRVPQPSVLGHNGCFNAFRILAQDVAGFEGYLDQTAEQLLADPRGAVLLPPGDEGRIGAGLTRRAALREVVAAALCGRWRNGVPLALSPETPNPEPAVSLTAFDYTDDRRCPVGAHIRRSNPRGAKIVQRVASHTRRLIRRGMPYGPRFDPDRPDHVERGLLGNFIGASLGAQFEAVMYDWVNLGLQDPRITGSNDPILGVNDPATSWFDLPLRDGKPIRLAGLPRFVTTRGGAYLFLPSLPALKFLASLSPV
ncbi:MAG TPA: hypothetical protein PK677_16265 [Acidiphilium sp.]|nr:hypothetical protein [Acidiphilium sp.]